jgi:DNA-binding transcriptional LysR family regulator
VARKIDWEKQIGRRLKLRDLHVFMTVVQRGSMAKAAGHLGVSQAAVSEIIADLEYALGARLFDRNPRGVEPTIYGDALLRHGVIAFDELKQAIKDIEYLSNSAVGELRIGCVESIASTVLPPVIQRFSQQYPRVGLHVHRLITSDVELMELRERSLDVVLVRSFAPLINEDDNLHVETLLDDHLVIVAGKQSRWAYRSRIDLAELVNEPWTLTPPNSANYVILADAFRVRGLSMPSTCLTTFCVDLRADLIATGAYLGAFAHSIMRLHSKLSSLQVLPIDLPARPWPVALVTLKNRTLNPVAQRFIDHLRAFTASIAAELESEKKSA